MHTTEPDRDGLPSVSRRDFLRVGGLSVVGASVAERAALAGLVPASQRSCIFLLMTGGASQLDTFDPKPAAPAEVRGPLRSIATAIPGVCFSEGLPGLARRADRLAVVRSLCHDAAPIHETGYQLLHAGRRCGKQRYPAFGSVAAHLLGPRAGAPPYVVLPGLLSGTGVEAWRGQQAGLMGAEFDPISCAIDPDDPFDGEPDSVRRLYGDTRFGRLCLAARRHVEAGTRVVVVNLFDRLSGHVTWDCHGSGAVSPATLFDYRDVLCPQFDRALSGLLDDLVERGRLDDTLVLATGEFGRTPRINGTVGRDHWPGAWSAVLAGGGISAGRVVGTSDRTASAPVDRPVHPGELAATIYRTLGIEHDVPLLSGDGRETPLCDVPPLAELFA